MAMTVAELQLKADSMRACPSYLEAAFAARLDSAGIRYRSQVVIDYYIVDFLLEDLRLIVELDGKQHNTVSAIAHDARRDAYLRKAGYKLIRIKGKNLWRFSLTNLGSAKKRASKKQRRNINAKLKRDRSTPRDAAYHPLDMLEDLRAVSNLKITQESREAENIQLAS